MGMPPGGENGLNLVGSIPDYHQEVYQAISDILEQNWKLM
jgi:hypothetical protein